MNQSALDRFHRAERNARIRTIASVTLRTIATVILGAAAGAGLALFLIRVFT